jgi:hypothetical protein
VVAGSGALYGIWGTSATNIFAVGNGGRILHFDGSAWTAMSSPTGARLSRVWGSAPADVWAVADTAVVHYDGRAWNAVTPKVISSRATTYSLNSSNSATDNGLWGLGPREVYVGAWYGQILRTDGASWGEMPGPFGVYSGQFVAIAGASSGCAIAVTNGLSSSGGPILFRGVGPTGCLATPMTPPASWP